MEGLKWLIVASFLHNSQIQVVILPSLFLKERGSRELTAAASVRLSSMWGVKTSQPLHHRDFLVANNNNEKNEEAVPLTSIASPRTPPKANTNNINTKTEDVQAEATPVHTPYTLLQAAKALVLCLMYMAIGTYNELAYIHTDSSPIVSVHSIHVMPFRIILITTSCFTNGFLTPHRSFSHPPE